MSASSERPLEQEPPEPVPPYSVDAWHETVVDCAEAAWRRTNLTVSWDTVYRLVDEALREFAPDCVPEGMR